MATQFEFEAIGTGWTIDITDEVPAEKKNLLEKSIHEKIDAFDKNYSRFRSDSLVTAWSKKAGKYLLPDDAEPMFELYKKCTPLRMD